MGRFILGVIVGVVIVPLVVLAWFRWGNPPVAVADHPLPFEKMIVHVPLHARIDRQMVHNPPIQPTEDNLVAGAQIYSDHCAECHGFYGKPSPMAPHMYPPAPQLWRKHPGRNVVGVSDDPPGATEWKVENGIRLTGMPAFKQLLTNTQMWQVSLLLAHANKPLPPAAIVMVSPPVPTTPPAATPAKKK